MLWMTSSGSPARDAGGAVIFVFKARASAFRITHVVADESCRWAWYNDFSPCNVVVWMHEHESAVCSNLDVVDFKSMVSLCRRLTKTANNRSY